MKRLAPYLLGLLFFQVAFWQEGLGLNLFMLFLLLLLYAKVELAWTWGKVPKLALLSTSASLLGLLLWHSHLSIWMSLLGLVLSVGLLHSPQGSSIEAWTNAFLNFFRWRTAWPNDVQLPSFLQKRPAVLLQVSLIPLLIVLLYILLFANGNALFGELLLDQFAVLSQWLQSLNFSWLAFSLLNISLVLWVLRRHWPQYLQLPMGQNLERNRRRTKRASMLGLKREHLSALILLVTLNGLFAVVNLLDIGQLWFGFELQAGVSLKSIVYEGTGFLLAILLISILLIAYYFRGNLNFYPNNALLKGLARFWILQNAVLAVSVVIRTAYYIDFHGLASKRIGLLMFCVLVLYGLFTLWVKVEKRKNLSYLLRRNFQFALMFLSLSALVPWDYLSLEVNLNHHNPHEIDPDYYLEADAALLPWVYAHKEQILDQVKAHHEKSSRWSTYSDVESFENALVYYRDKFLDREETQGWGSWNLADHLAYNKLYDLHYAESVK